MQRRTFLLLPGLAAARFAHAQELVPGTHYRLISPTQPTSSAASVIEVAEFFQFSCPGCFAMEPHLNAWIANEKPADVEVVRVHVTWNALAKLHAQAFYTAGALGKSAEIHGAFFDEFHRQGNHLDTEDKLAAFFGRFGVSAADFGSVFESFSVDTKVNRAGDLMRRYTVAQTPTLVVNGTYVVLADAVDSYEGWFGIVSGLADLERAKLQQAA